VAYMYNIFPGTGIKLNVNAVWYSGKVRTVYEVWVCMLGLFLEESCTITWASSLIEGRPIVFCEISCGINMAVFCCGHMVREAIQEEEEEEEEEAFKLCYCAVACWK